MPGHGRPLTTRLSARLCESVSLRRRADSARLRTSPVVQGTLLSCRHREIIGDALDANQTSLANVTSEATIRQLTCGFDKNGFQCNTGFQQTLKMPVLVKSEDVEHAAGRLAAVFREVPFLAQAGIRRTNAPRGSAADFILSVRSPKFERRLVCEVKPSGQPRVAREACRALREEVRADRRDYPVFIAPYIAPAAADICREYQVGYFDLAGNCRLAFDHLYIRREGFPNPSVQRRGLRSLFSPKAERVLRVLVAGGKRYWRMQQLAAEAGVSLGQAAQVKKLLVDREWIETGARGLRLRPLEDGVLPMLAEWREAYRGERNTAHECYSLKPLPEMERELANAGRRMKAGLAFTGFSGAARFAPAVRYQRVTAYILVNPRTLAKRLGLKAVASGANVTLVEPYDEGVLYGAAERDGAPVVSPVQLYLDLSRTKGRGEEAAAAILEQVIKPLWR